MALRQWIVTCLLVLPSLVAAQPGGRPPTDLDRLMEEVVKRRDDNWKKLQQYILAEREKVTVTGPDGLRLYGSVHDYQWFVKDGFFIRSPLAANGVTIADAERRRYEARYLMRMKARDERRAKRDAESPRAAAGGRPSGGRPADATGRALVRLGGVLLEVRVRARPLRARWPRDQRRPGGPADRVLPSAPLR